MWKTMYYKNYYKKCSESLQKKSEFRSSEKYVRTRFDKSHFDRATIYRIVACFLMFQYRKANAQAEIGVATGTIVDWFNFYREIYFRELYFNIS